MSAGVEFGFYADHIGFQVHATWRAIQKKILAGRKKQSLRKLSPGSYSIPALIAFNPGISPQELADALYLDASKVALFLRAFDQDDLIDRVASQEDKRKTNLYLTEKGLKFVEETLDVSKRWESLISTALSVDERQNLIALLTKIRSAM